MEMQRLQITIQGQVQGVGFRPHVYRTAKLLGLTGWVRNHVDGVLIEVQGEAALQFIKSLASPLPPLAIVRHIETKLVTANVNETSFEIVQSDTGKTYTLISPDASICDDCLYELFDPQSRYYHYPFLNCTNCGPRFTIAHKLPYDRCHTSMNIFPLCPDCKSAYLDPENRRYHAQPSACVECGPQLSHSIDVIANAIKRGKIIAIKGIGGYQLICDANNESAISELRSRKNRSAKPFALMVANTQSARRIAIVNEHAEKLLNSVARPIILLEKKNNLLPDLIAPGLTHYGMMLPYTPLHYLLFNAFSGKKSGKEWMNEVMSTTLVFTSANIGGNPLVIDNQSIDGKTLSHLADIIVSYNREIVTRADDSVIRIINDAPAFIRRARGYVPSPIQLPHSIPPTLAVGGHLKNTFCITRGDEAFVSQHIGDLNNKDTIKFFHESLNYLLKFLGVSPERIAHDLHPDFYTSCFAANYGIPTYPIQHHHAHLASVAAEHHVRGTVLGLALDGYGFGSDGGSWGGELLLLDHTAFQRLGHLTPLPQPGGDVAAREPWRMAASVLHLLGRNEEITKRFSGYSQARFIHQLLDKRLNSPMTSSCGRLFDAAAAILGVQTISQYEGHAPMLLESLVTNPIIASQGWHICDGYLDLMPLLEMLLNIDDPVMGANLFHGTLIAALAAWIERIARKIGIDTILLSGGCFSNKILTEGLSKSLSELDIKPLSPRDLPPNDGGISLGQAWIAGRLKD